MKTISLIILMSVSALLSGGNVMATEELSYVMVQEYEDFELRRYDSYLAAEIEITSDFKSAGNKAFQSLAGYIGGNNRKKEEISMTSPVKQQPATEQGEKISMTSPVKQTPGSTENGKNSYIISFVMPSKYTMKNIPEPTNPRIKIREVPGRLVAARQYSGTWSEKNYRKNETILLDAVEAAGLKTSGKPIYARYNPPWSPWFMRRNEVLVEVEDQVPRNKIQ